MIKHVLESLERDVIAAENMPLHFTKRTNPERNQPGKEAMREHKQSAIADAKDRLSYYMETGTLEGRLDA